MNETDADLRFYIDLYVDCGFTYDEARVKAILLLAKIGVVVEALKMPVNKDDEDVISAYAGKRIDINYAIAIHLRRAEFIANLILWGIKNKTRKA